MLDRKTAHRPARAVTIHDVARHAGVSRMTVSRVINGEKSVKPATRDLVDAAIRELGYAPNPAARTLAGGAIMRIGLLYRIPNPAYLTEFLVGALDRCSEINAQLIVQRHGRNAGSEAAADELIRKRLDGVILPPPLGDDPALVEKLRDAGMAVVATGSTRPTPSLASIGIDDFGAARDMTRHLIGLGHKRIGFITGRPNHASSGLRLDGYRAALAEAGLPADEKLVADGTFTYESGLDAAEQLIALEPMPTAIFASNDDMAAATVAAAHRHRLDVPADLSVAGFDDTPLATTIWPELTTIRQPVSAMSEEAVTILAGLIRQQRAGEEPDAPHRLLDFELIRRQSDAPPRRP
jgi:LacI family transcriptional regulator